MKEFNSIEEMKPYYDETKNLFYIEDDIQLNFNLNCDWNINAYDINAYDITAIDIYAKEIDAGNITARYINAQEITASDIIADDMNAYDIFADNITARNIIAGDIIADNMETNNIKAGDISYFAVCFAYKSIICERIKGRRKNSKHFVLDGVLHVGGEEK